MYIDFSTACAIVSSIQEAEFESGGRQKPPGSDCVRVLPGFRFFFTVLMFSGLFFRGYRDKWVMV